MADHTKWQQILDDKLLARRLEVGWFEETLNVQSGQSTTAARANLDPAPLWDVLDGADETGVERLIAGYVSGVKHVLLEPKRSEASQWEYTRAAGRLMPNLEVHTFRLGAEAAADTPPWTVDFHEDLVVAYLINLDGGMRVVTEAQVDQWAAAPEQVTAAARSLLFHKSRDHQPVAVDGVDGVELFSVGDGHDAMRSTVVADLFFADFDDTYRFTMPTQDALLFVRGHRHDDLDLLRAATDTRVRAADYPLSSSIYRFELGRPQLDEPRDLP